MDGIKSKPGSSTHINTHDDILNKFRKDVYDSIGRIHRTHAKERIDEDKVQRTEAKKNKSVEPPVPPPPPPAIEQSTSPVASTILYLYLH